MHRGNDRHPISPVEDGMLKRNREDLVRSESGIVTILTVHDVVQITARGAPKARVEGVPRLVGMRPDLAGFRIPRFAQPTLQQAERAVPKRVDLDRLAAARGYHPIADFRIHPGERVTLRPLSEEPVMRVDLDAETGALEMVSYDVLQERQKELQGRFISTVLDVAVQCVKEPQRRIGSVVEALVLSLREQ